MQKKWSPLLPNDTVYLIAPSSIAKQQDLEKACQLISSWGLTAKHSENIFGHHPISKIFANEDNLRSSDLKYALLEPKVKAIWCLRGGYGAMRLLSTLENIQQRPAPKLFMGFSDITILHIYLQQNWGWSTVHGPSATQAGNQRINAKHIECVKQLLLGEISSIEIPHLTAMNSSASNHQTLTTQIIGGNLTLISRTLGTPYAIDCHNKILLIEEIDEPFRKVDGMLLQLELAGYFSKERSPAAVIIGDFITNSIAGDDLDATEKCLHAFAEKLNERNIPVLRTPAIGHGSENIPVPMGTPAILQLGKHLTLTVST